MEFFHGVKNLEIHLWPQEIPSSLVFPDILLPYFSWIPSRPLWSQCVHSMKRWIFLSLNFICRGCFNHRKFLNIHFYSKVYFHDKFLLTNLETLHYFFKLEIIESNSRITMEQSKYALDILSWFHMANYKTCMAHFLSSTKVKKN